ncbi:975_t:CDS:2 [Scutellospora calospora]|uniref:975_t:CDS:1 n=1 Tax=Scutellospora calospora TaxID=85575 RepID=A0ACA9KJN7_9GLOM|nr:975_t:CDS:2 [Scutellospora calospora]
MSKENQINNPDVAEDTNNVTHDDKSDTIVKPESVVVATTSSESVTTSSNDIVNPVVSTSQQTSPKVPKQSATQRAARKTRGASKAVSTAENSSSSSIDKLDYVAATSTNIPSNFVPAFAASSGQSSNNNRRQLPQKDVTQANIADRYVEFILYCNPSAPSDLDVSSLIRSFNAVPKSDGKTFDTWVLFQLVSKHHSGEIKTWTKLAQQLGVERTSGSSPQKIQQYAVRLKKWMRSIHIDAFFDYILSKPNEYYEDPQKNPTGIEPTDGTDDDDSDLVLKLIKRASSKRQKRKYTRRNTGSSIDVGDNHTNDDNIDNDDDFDDDADPSRHDDRSEKRIKATYSDASDELDYDDERDAWEDDENMQVDDSGKVDVDGKSKSSRRKNNVQFTSSRENRPKLGRPKNGMTSRHIPTPIPSPTDIRHHSNSSGGDTSHFRVISNSSSAGSPATQLRWRSISVGGGPISTQSGETSPSQPIIPTAPSTSPTHKGNVTSRRKTSSDASVMGFDSFRLSKKRHHKERPQSPTSSNWSWSPQNNLNSQDNNNNGFSYSELLLPPTTLTNDPKETIIMLQEKLVKAVGMLEDNQRKIDMLENVVRQREDEVRKRVARGLKKEVITLFQSYE